MDKPVDWCVRSTGTGKTTLLLQYAKGLFVQEHEMLYLTLDDIYFSENKLSDVAARFRQEGGKLLLLDEVHKYPDWAREIKNTYDFYRDLNIVFTGYSISDMLRQSADLSRGQCSITCPGYRFANFYCLHMQVIFRRSI